jgi:hypothetical protein
MKTIIQSSLLILGLASSVYATPKISGSLAHQFQKNDSVDNGYVVNTKVILKNSGAVNNNISYGISYAERIVDQNDAIKNEKLGLSNAKFIIRSKYSTIIAGRQGLTTPWTNGASLIDSTNIGNGILVLAPTTKVTLVGAYVVNHNILLPTIVGKSSDIAIIGALGKIGSTNIEAWYSSIGEDEQGVSSADDDKGLIGMSLATSTDIENININARYSSVTSDALAKDQSLLSFEASARVRGVKLNAGFASSSQGDKVSLDEAGNAANTIYAGTWNLSMGNGSVSNDGANLIGVGLTVPVDKKFTANINYGQRTGKGVNDASEIKAEISSHVAKNMTLYFRAAKVSFDDTSDLTGDKNYIRTRLYGAYKF